MQFQAVAEQRVAAGSVAVQSKRCGEVEDSTGDVEVLLREPLGQQGQRFLIVPRRLRMVAPSE